MILRQRFLNCSGSCLLVLAAAAPATAEETSTGTATALDGGTLEINGARLTLWGIAAPDPLTAHGWSSQLYLKVAIATGPVSCRKKAPDRWQCQTAEGSDLGSLLIQTGQARAADPYYQFEEDRARVAGVGVWSTAEQRGR